MPKVPVARALFLRHLEDVEIPARGENIPGLLLGIAGRLADGQVLDRSIRAGVGQREAQGGLDQGADVAGEDLLGIRNRQGRPAAEGHGDGPQGQDELIGDVDAERADELVAGGAPLDDLLDARAVGAVDDVVEVSHPAGAVLLGQDGLAENPVYGVEDLVVELDVQAESFQELVVAGHDPLRASAGNLFHLAG